MNMCDANPHRGAKETLRLLTMCAGVLVAGFNLGCGRAGSSPESSTGGAPATSAAQPASDQAAGPNRCALLADQEVGDAIGPHTSGSSSLDNEWGLQSCRWTATTVRKDGWTDSIEVTLFNPERQSYEREHASGDPV